MQNWKKYNIIISVFSYENKKPYSIYSSKQNIEEHVDLLLIANIKNSHYVLINGFNRFVTNKTKHYQRYCLQYFKSSKILEIYVKILSAINQTKAVMLYEENTYIKFQNLKYY